MPNQAPSINAIKSTYDVTRVSTDAAGMQGNDTSGGGVFSPDGSKIAFSSNASNLVAGAPADKSYLFLKDLTTGAITLVAAADFGIQGNVRNFSPAFSPDGSKIAYLGSGGLTVQDLTTGATTQIPVNQDSITGLVFSPDGSKIAFAGSNTNLGHSSYVAYQVYVKDLITGALTSASGPTSSINFGSTGPSFSPDGSKIAFYSDVRLVEPDTSNTLDVFVKDLTTGAITRVSAEAAGSSSADSRDPVFSPDGSKIAFDSNLSNLVAGDTNNAVDIFVKDLATGTVTRVSVDGAGAQGNGASSAPVFSPDGSKIAFYSTASNLVDGDTNNAYDIFVKDLSTGAVTRVSVDAAGAQGNSDSAGLRFSPDGGRIVFSSSASNLVAGDTNGKADVFVKDLTLQHEDPAVYIENAAAVAVNTEPVTITDVDNTAFGGGSLTAALTAGSHAADGLTLIVSVESGIGIEVTGASVSYNGTVIGTLSGSGTASLSVALNASADVTAVQALAGAVGFLSGSDDPTADARTVSFTLVDGSGTAGGGHDTGSFTQTVLVTAVNDAPVNTVPGAISTPGNIDHAIAGLSVNDPDATSLTTTLHVDHGTLTVAALGGATVGGSGTATVTLTGSVAQIDAALAAADNVIYHSVAGFHGADALTVLSSDGGGTGTGGTQSDTDTVAINVSSRAHSDFNGDGFSDVLWRNNSSGDTGYTDFHAGNVWHGLGASSIAYSVVGTGDFNGDGFADALWRNNSSGDTGYTDFHGGNAWNGLGASSTAYSVVGTGDFNGDGFADILYRNAASGDTGYSDQHNAGAWHGLGASSTAYSVVGTGDFNGDGFSDVLWRDNTSGDTGYTDFHAGNAWHGLGASSTAYNVVGVGDFNGDGFADALWRNNSSGDTGYTDFHAGNVWNGLGASSTAYSVVAVGDYSGDGFDDILYRNAASGDTGYSDLHANTWHGLGAASTDYLVVA